MSGHYPSIIHLQGITAILKQRHQSQGGRRRIRLPERPAPIYRLGNRMTMKTYELSNGMMLDDETINNNVDFELEIKWCNRDDIEQ